MIDFCVKGCRLAPGLSVVLNFLGDKIMLVLVLFGKDKNHWFIFLFRLVKPVQTYLVVSVWPVVKTVAFLEMGDKDIV